MGGGALGRDTKGRNKCYCTRLHTAKHWIDRNMDHLPHSQNNMYFYLKTEVAIRNEKFVINTWRTETILGIREFTSCCTMKEKPVQYVSGWEHGGM